MTVGSFTSHGMGPAAVAGMPEDRVAVGVAPYDLYNEFRARLEIRAAGPKSLPARVRSGHDQAFLRVAGAVCVPMELSDVVWFHQ